MANFDTLKASIRAKIHDNTEQEISAEDVRDSFLDTIDAVNAAKEDTGAAVTAWGEITGTLAAQTDLKDALDGKQGTIADLSAIRSGAAAGATAVQPGDLATVATTGDYDDLLNKPTIPAAPGVLNTNNTTAQAVSSAEALSGTVKLHKVSKTGSYADLNNKPTIPAAQVNSDWNAVSGVEQILNKPTLAAVATSGDYDDLTNKPVIPTVHNMAAGGTTGQVLAKKSNTDYDTEWVNQSGGGGGAAAWGSITGDLDDQTDLKNALDAKQDVISNLATIESGAAAGATAVQPGDLATVATTGDYDDLLNKPTIDATPTSASTNAVQSGGVYSELADRYTKTELAAMAETWTFTLADNTTVTKKIIVLP